MGFFTPKISDRQLLQVQNAMNQLRDTVKLINTTTKPDVFFKRLNFALDLLLYLQTYEKYKIFKGATPTQDYQSIIKNMEKTVDNFIDRAVEANQQKLASLKTAKARASNYEKFVTALISAFDCANTFWSGNIGYPHYTGNLFTANNYQRVQALWDNLN